MKRWFGWLLPLVLLANSCLLPVALGPASTTAPIATNSGVKVVDVSDPTAPRLVSRYATLGEARDLAVQWPYLLVAAGDSGLRVLDIGDPLHLVEVASHQSCDSATQVISANGLLYVMQPLGGLWLLRLTGHESPEEAP